MLKLPAVRTSFLRILLGWFGVWAALLAVGARPAFAQREPPIPKELLERIGDWAESFLDNSPSFAAEETLWQTQRDKKGGAARKIVSDYICVRPASSRERWQLRDVLSVDGKDVHNSSKRAGTWARLLAAQSWKELSTIAEAPAKYQLAPEQFSGLDRLAGRLAARYHDRMRYFFAQDTSDVSSRNILIGYRQISGEGLAVVDGKPVPVSGKAWVDPDNGRVVRIEEEVESKQARYWMAVEFGPVTNLDAWLPQAITVRVFEKGHLTLESVYAYSNFRSLPFDRRADSTSKH